MLVSDQAPPVASPDQFLTADFQECGRFSGTPDIATVNCTEPVRGRYVYIYLPRTDVLTLCEVEVYQYSKYRIFPFNTIVYLRILMYDLDKVEHANVCLDKVEHTNVCLDKVEHANVCLDKVEHANVYLDKVEHTNVCLDR